MSGQSKLTRRKASRTMTWAALVLVPALAVVALGTGLSLFATGPAAPGGLLVAETRDFAAQGDAVTAVANPTHAANVEQFMDDWQNTVRLPPSPRR
jgi:hypothetical protein